jgi:oligosaccharide repeat unit polymerase
MGDYDLLYGTMRINTFLFIINSILIIHFFLSWYLSYKKTGWKIDYWYLTMFLSYFLPFLLMYPFAGSILNVLAVGNNITIIQDYVDKAYIINLIGYMAIFLGRFIFNTYKFENIINYVFIFPVKLVITRPFIAIAKSEIASRILYVVYFASIVVILSMAFVAGQFLNPRGYFFENNNINFIYNFALILSIIISLILIARIYEYNKLFDKICFYFYLVISLFIGARSYIILPIIQYFSFYIFFKKQGKVNLLKASLFGFFILFVVMFIGSFREGGPISIMQTLSTLFASTFYGNSFSDLRDFGFVLSFWDNTLLHGKTYLAAFMSFIPSFISPFRTEWSIGKVTATMVGFDPALHPGLRPGLFGESYLNFGIIGVFILGVLLGYSYRYIDYKIKYISINNTKLNAVAALVSTLFISNLTITAGFFSLYVFLIVLIILVIIKYLIGAVLKDKSFQK